MGHKLNSSIFYQTSFYNVGVSGTSTQTKYKNKKDGSTAKYIYYGCTRAKDLNCKNGYIREVDLIEQFEGLIDKVSINKFSVSKTIEKELERVNKFQAVIGGKETERKKVKEVDIRNYAKYLLQEGTILEKRNLMLSFESQIILDKKLIKLK